MVPPNKPQRPPAPQGKTGSETKDKVEVQAHIRSLKENNSALTEINSQLEDKLFKVGTCYTMYCIIVTCALFVQLIEERVRLAKQLKALQELQQVNHQQ